jgi:prepilin-type processing-associated H-X9-DG protein/prepilin-type N-terminal cleavage/methylation domain-containing protein
MKWHPSTESRNAVTLIELVLVIALIAILAALLLPSIEQVRQRARRTQCVSNLRQIGVAFLSFANSHEDKFPILVSVANGGILEFATGKYDDFTYRNFQALSNELVDPRVLVCPSDPLRRTNAFIFATLSNVNLSYFVFPRSNPHDSDSWLSGDCTQPELGTARVTQTGIEASGWERSYWHGNGVRGWICNALFADGHVESLKTQWVGRTSSSLPLSEPISPPASTGVGGGQGGAGTTGSAAGTRGGAAASGGSSGGSSKNSKHNGSGFAALQNFFQPPGASQNTTPQSSTSSSTPTPPTAAPVPPSSSDTRVLTENSVQANSTGDALTNRAAPAVTNTAVPHPSNRSATPEAMASKNVSPDVTQPAERPFNWLLLILLAGVAVGLGVSIERRLRRRRTPETNESN